MKRDFRYGQYEYSYELIYEARKSLRLTVEPDQAITLRAPHDAGEERITRFLESKWRWLDKQLRMFNRYHKKQYERSYVSGESLMYLGRQYELIVEAGETDSVGLLKGKIRVSTSMGVQTSEYTKMLIEGWYRNRRNFIFRELYAKALKHFGAIEPPRLIVKEMQKRWGSFTNAGNVVINPRLIESDKAAIEYVMVHELCHLTVKNHGADFKALLDQKISGWREIKDRLELRHG